MKARTVTLFYDPAVDAHAAILPKLSAFSAAAAEALEAIAIPLQSTRLATTPLLTWASAADSSLATLAVNLEAMASEHGFTYLSLGTLPAKAQAQFSLIPEILSATRNVFITATMTRPDGGVDLGAIQQCGSVIEQAARITPDGFANLRFAALANVPAGTPFLPAAYHTPGAAPACAIGIETADEINRIFHQAQSFEAARTELLAHFEAMAAKITAAITPLCARFGIQLLGFDFSTAPFPSADCSAGTSMEALGLNAIGRHGSLASAAFLADTLDRGQWQRTGFNGLMLPVLEDAGLARRAAEGSLTVRDLLLFSAVCGTGLDTVPLPGNASAEQLSALLADVAVLSQRLRKPLTARLMPIPGKSAGQPIHFDFEFFADGKVMALEADPLHGLLGTTATFDLQPRPWQTNAPL
jgi:uncharacterized protein (UPF0210 family)